MDLYDEDGDKIGINKKKSATTINNSHQLPCASMAFNFVNGGSVDLFCCSHKPDEVVALMDYLIIQTGHFIDKEEDEKVVPDRSIG